MKDETERLKADLSALRKRGWDLKDKSLRKTYQFGSFGDAIAFMTRCALEIEKRDHHPEWLNVYSRLSVTLTTHSAGEVTSKDVELAMIMDKIATRFIKEG